MGSQTMLLLFENALFCDTEHKSSRRALQNNSRTLQFYYTISVNNFSNGQKFKSYL